MILRSVLFYHLLLLLLLLAWISAASAVLISSNNNNNITVPENVPVGYVVHTVEVEDSDSGAGGAVLFSLTGTDLLQIDKATGQITVRKAIDRELVNVIACEVRIRRLLPPMSAQQDSAAVVTLALAVTVLDVNDNTPTFDKDVYEVFVSESVAPGTVAVDSMVVSDADSLTGQLSVSCHQQTSTAGVCQMFRIAPRSSASDEIDSNNNNRTRSDLPRQESVDASLPAHQQRMFMLVVAGALTGEPLVSQQLTVSLQVTDGVHTGSSSVLVHVLDVQNRPPLIAGSRAVLISETAPVGTVVTKIRATDGDTVRPRNITFRLLDNPGGHFAIDPVSGRLTVAQPLDRESQLLENNNSLNVRVKASEVDGDGTVLSGPMSETVHTIAVTVEDADDEPPRFNSQNFTVMVPENTVEGSPLPGAQITVSDPDLGRGGVFTVRLLDDLGGRFSVSPATGRGLSSLIIRLARGTLDYELPEDRQLNLQLVAQGSGDNSTLSSRTTVSIFVTDVNDNAPHFAQATYVAQVSEVSVPGTIVTTVTATDADSAQYGADGLIYRLTGDGSDKFLISEQCGTVVVAACDNPGAPPCIDHETQRHFRLTVEVADNYGRGHVARVPLYISSRDANDNPPAIARSSYSAVIREGASDFEPPLFVEARDADVSSQLTFSLMHVGGVFVMDAVTGRVSVNSSARAGDASTGLDISDVGSARTKLIAQVTDGVFTTSVPIDVTIIDTNNHRPQFVKSSYSAVLPDSVPIGTVVERVHAVDLDSGDNARLQYRIGGGARGRFSLDTDSGVLLVSGQLRRDTHADYRLIVHAVDSGSPPLTGTTTVSVSILGTNSQMPMFTPRTQYAEVSESAVPGTVFHQLSAADADVPARDQLQFALAGVLAAVDADGNRIESTLVSTFKSLFNVSETGAVSVASQLSRDTVAAVTVRVRVTDVSAVPVQSALGRLLVTIVDVNDGAPRFPAPWSPHRPQLATVQLREQLAVGTVFGRVTASDNGRPVRRYQLAGSRLVDIDTGTGELSVRAPVDFETVQSVNVNITAFDSGVPQRNATALLKIDIINVNDEPPVFTQAIYYANVTEQTDNGWRHNGVSDASEAIVARVEAVDADHGEFGAVTYTISDVGADEAAALFTVDHHGTIRLAPGADGSAAGGRLDRERTPSLTLLVLAHDMGPLNYRHTATAQVEISVLDVNDEVPVFEQSQYTVTIAENIPLSPPSPILQVRAVDADAADNGRVVYSLVPTPHSDWFRVDRLTGLLYPVLQPVSTQSAEIGLTVLATDGVHNATTSVLVRLKTVNQHQPRFVAPSRDNAVYYVIENEERVGDVVLRVEAVDDDQLEDGRISYHFRVDNNSVNTTDAFHIDCVSGRITSRINFDRELREEYRLLVVARDHGAPVHHESVRYLVVRVRDVNDNAPQFGQKLYQFSLVENRPAGTEIGWVTAVDCDSAASGVPLYYAVAGDTHALMVTKQGRVLSRIVADRETRANYRLIVKATNDVSFSISNHCINTSDSSIAEIQLTVLDENDSAPEFAHPLYFAGVSEMARFGDLVLQVTALDEDKGTNANLTYSIRSSNIFKPGAPVSSGSILPSPFGIDASGRLSCATLMTEYGQHRFQLLIAARELAAPFRQHLTRVHVWVYADWQLVYLLLALPPATVHAQRRPIELTLSNVTESRVVIASIRQHSGGRDHRANTSWSDVYVLACQPASRQVVAPARVVARLDAASDRLLSDEFHFLHLTHAQAAVSRYSDQLGPGVPSMLSGGPLSPLPVAAAAAASRFPSSLTVLLALLALLAVGLLVFCVCCYCVRRATVAATASHLHRNLHSHHIYRHTLQKHVKQLQSGHSAAISGALGTTGGCLPAEPPEVATSSAATPTGQLASRHRPVTSLSSRDFVDSVPTAATTPTENPLWTERKPESYEEQELCMNVSEGSSRIAASRAAGPPHSCSFSPSALSNAAATVSTEEDGCTAGYATIQPLSPTRSHPQPHIHHHQQQQQQHHHHHQQQQQQQLPISSSRLLPDASDNRAVAAAMAAPAALKSRLSIAHDGQPELVAELC